MSMRVSSSDGSAAQSSPLESLSVTSRRRRIHPLRSKAIPGREFAGIDCG
jgi:hypothetical protein